MLNEFPFSRVVCQGRRHPILPGANQFSCRQGRWGPVLPLAAPVTLGRGGCWLEGTETFPRGKRRKPVGIDWLSV